MTTETETKTKLRHFVITFEWHNTVYVRRVCEGATVEEAIKDGFENMDDCSDQDTYDDSGDTFVGAVIEYPTPEAAEEAQRIGYATARQSLPIPFEHDDDCNKVRIVTEERDALRVLLATARADLEKMTTHADAFVGDWADDVDPEAREDFDKACLAVENARHTIAAIDGLVKEPPIDIVRVAACNMLTTLQEVEQSLELAADYGFTDELAEVQAAIGAAKAVGLTATADTRTGEA